MLSGVDDGIKVKLYELLISRYRELLNERESASVSFIRQKVSPYSDQIKAVRDLLIADLKPYEQASHFFLAVERAIVHVGKIKVVSIPFTFWLSFTEMESIGLASETDRSIFLTSLIRAFGSEDVCVLVTKKGRTFVRFSWKDGAHFISGESLSILSQDDAWKIFATDPLAYAFSDLIYEDYDSD